MKICMDVGHGGTDPGAVNLTVRLYEKDVNLVAGDLLKAMLIELGHEVLMTRTGDTYVSLSDRVKASNDWKADFFISLHCNAAESKKATGIETWYYKQYESAKKLQNSIIEANPSHVDRGEKQGTFYVLKNTTAPAVLVEMEFISNDEMAEWLKDEVNLAGIVLPIAKTLDEIVK